MLRKKIKTIEHDSMVKVSPKYHYLSDMRKYFLDNKQEIFANAYNVYEKQIVCNSKSEFNRFNKETLRQIIRIKRDFFRNMISAIENQGDEFISKISTQVSQFSFSKGQDISRQEEVKMCNKLLHTIKKEIHTYCNSVCIVFIVSCKKNQNETKQFKLPIKTLKSWLT